MSNGWIKIHRSIKDHWITKNPVYFHAWILILMDVNHQDKKVLIDGVLHDCKRGESINSISTWVEIFGNDWTRQKVRTFFALLEKDQMINQQGLRKTTKLSVCNYETYQTLQPADNPQTNQQPTNSQPTDNHKQEREESKEDNIYTYPFAEFPSFIDRQLYDGYMAIRLKHNQQPQHQSIIQTLNAFERKGKGLANQSLSEATLGEYKRLYQPDIKDVVQDGGDFSNEF